LFVFGVTTAATGIGLSLGATRSVPTWALGQLLLAGAFVEWFVLLHECGHCTLFGRRRANVLAGHVAGFFAFIPYGIWVHIHRRHHKWTGWQDMDPTTATLAPQPRSRVERFIVSICWKYWVPLFSIVYRLGNFWNPSRLRQLYSTRQIGWRVVSGLFAVAGLYAALVWQLGPFELARIAGVATLLAFVAEDVLIISQHTHVPMDLSGGLRVPPHRALDQERFTRSLRFPPLVSRMALHFDAHELHHMYPFVPGYRLREIPYQPTHEVGWWRWIRAARAFPGEALLFQNRHQTGFDL
jgi:omega-6 fatty acid desaturase (delta-12 desaturase)